MNSFEALVLGLIQGLTEFIPISSSGHLVIAQTFFSGASDHLFLEWINVGTVLALLVFFRVRIRDAVVRIVVGRDYRLARNVVVAMVPAGLVGFLFSHQIENTAFFGSVWTVVVMLVVVGILLVLLEKLPKQSRIETAEALPARRALTIGVAQMFALIPGTSRSGATIIAGRLSGLNRADAAEFSFLVSIPIMLGVLLKLVVSSGGREYFAANASALVLGNLAALVSGLLAVGFLMKFLEKNSLAVFGWYRIGLAVVITLVLLVQ